MAFVICTIFLQIKYKIMSTTFDVCLNKKSFQINTKKIENLSTTRNLINGYCNDFGIEQASNSIDIAPGNSGLIDLSKYSFNEHRHLILDPDTIWLTIANGLAIHIKENAEELRHQFVNFKGKQDILIQRDHFIKGQSNDWEGCFDEFSDKISDYIGPKRDLIVSNFSSTTKLAKVSSEIILMDAMSKYFNYGMNTRCGIPLVTIEGTVEDWEKLKEKVYNISEFDLKWWTDELIPVLDKIVESSKGSPDVGFWEEWYSISGGSGGPYISGHVTKFYPYLGNDKKHKTDWSKLKGSMFGGITEYQITNSYSSVPFVWNYHGTKYSMEFIGGIIGVKAEDNGAVKSNFGWAVREKSCPLDQYPMEYLEVDLVVHNKDNKTGLLKNAEFTEFGEIGSNNYSKRLDAVFVLWDGETEVKRHAEYVSYYDKNIKPCAIKNLYVKSKPE